jgi:tryptophan-rich sensory protein
MKRIGAYLLVPAILFLTIVLGQYFMTGSHAWYQTIILPEWTPRGGFIGTMWAMIYTLTLVAALLIFKRKLSGFSLTSITILFLINAFLNVFWTYLFFYKHRIGAAVVDAAALGLSVVSLIIVLYPKSKTSALLLVPYALWVIFATYLNFVIWQLN